MSPRDLKALNPLQLADAEAQIVDPEAHAGELTAGQWRRRLRGWLSEELDLWTARLERIGKWLKAVLTVLGGLGAIGGFVWKAYVFYRARNVSPAEQQATGVASTAIDRVDRPSPPKP